MADRHGWIVPEPQRRAKSAVAVALSFAIILGGLGFAGWKGYGIYMDYMQRDDWIGEGADPVKIVVQPGSGWNQVATTLIANDVIKDSSLFQKAALKLSDGPTPGTWQLKTHLPAATAAAMMTDPANKVLIRLTVPEGTRVDGLYAILSDATGMSREEFDAGIAAAKADPASISLDPAAGGNLEGFLFPDTYILSPPIDTDIKSILTRMAKQFTIVSGGMTLADQAAANDKNEQQAVVIASIIDAEVNIDEYRPMVARAIYNRLNQNMPLGLESAFRYGRMVTDGTPYDDPINSDSQHDANLPYNYYIKTGLPDTPIGNPGKQALEAAVNPADGDWLYWVTVNLDTGETKFASSDTEFEQYRAEFQQWCSAHGNPTGCQ